MNDEIHTAVTENLKRFNKSNNNGLIEKSEE